MKKYHVFCYPYYKSIGNEKHGIFYKKGLKMNKLVLGKMNNEQLAQWFGIGLKTFTNTKKKKLEELKLFAEFYEEKGKIFITKIYNDTYAKQGSTSYQMIRDKVDEFWSDTGLDSCKRVSNKIVKYYGKELPVEEGTAYNYTRRSRNELYGVPFGANGKLGSCIYTWCKKGEDDGLIPLTEEEEEIKKELIKKYFGSADEKQIIVAGMVEAGEIKKEEAWDILTELTNMKGSNFMMFLGELQERLQCQIIRGTLVSKNESILIEDSAF